MKLLEDLLGYTINWRATGQLAGAIGVVITLSLTWLTHRQRVTFEMIDRLYSLCHTLEGHLLTEWRLSHLFCVGGGSRAVYEETKEKIVAAFNLQDATKEERFGLIVSERLFAVHIFIAFEQVFYHYKLCGWFNSTRKQFLEDMLDYFCTRMIRNPRMLAYLLSSDIKGEQLHLEKDSMEELLLRAKPFLKEADTEGPFKFDPAGPHEVAKKYLEGISATD
jgi:hypothetical protein